jgi:hypothetical protein
MLIHFELSRLSDGMLGMMLESTLDEEKQRANSPLLRAMQTALADEELRRVALRAGKEAGGPVRLILPLMDREEIASALGHLTKETLAFETAANGAKDLDPILSAEYRTAAEFCCAVGTALKEGWRGLAVAQSGAPN